jgi:predicted outer membrane protein
MQLQHRVRTRRLVWGFGTVAASTLVVLSASIAQTEREGQRYAVPPNSREVRANSAAAYDTDAHLAQWLLMDNEAQFAVSRFAFGRAQTDAVKDYAEVVMESHRLLVRQLIRIANVAESTRGPRMGIVTDEPAMIRGSALPPERQRLRATAADEVLEKEEALPVRETKSGAPGTGQETGPTGTRARDVRQGETGTDDSRTIAEPAPRRPRVVISEGPAGVGTKGRIGATGTPGDELRERDRRLDTFDRVGELPVTEPNRRDDETALEQRARIRVGTRVTQSQSARAIVDAILEDVLRERIELTRQELAGHSGLSFDRAFLHHQLTAHTQSLSLIRGLRGNVAGELEKLLDWAESENWAHLDQAHELLDEL